MPRAEKLHYNYYINDEGGPRIDRGSKDLPQSYFDHLYCGNTELEFQYVPCFLGALTTTD